MNDSQAGKAERPIAADILMDAQSPTWIILKHSVRMSFSSYARMCGFMYVRMFWCVGACIYDGAYVRAGRLVGTQGQFFSGDNDFSRFLCDLGLL